MARRAVAAAAAPVDGYESVACVPGGVITSGEVPKEKEKRKESDLRSRLDCFRERRRRSSRRRADLHRGEKRRSQRWCCFWCSCCKKLLLLGSAALMLLVLVSRIYKVTHATNPCRRAAESTTLLELLPSKEEANDSSGKRKLPKIVHQQWKSGKDTIPTPFSLWRESWRLLFPPPEYEHVLWTDDDCLALVKEHYGWFSPTYESYDRNIKRVDACRYFVLHRHGGLYADLDYEPLVNFWRYLPTSRVGIVESPHQYSEKHQNSLMSSPPGHDFWPSVVFGMLVERAEKPVLRATGPAFVDAAIRTYAAAKKGRHRRRHPEGRDDAPAYTLPCENFHRIPSIAADPRNSISPWFTRYWNHWLLGGWLVPMKDCGDFDLTEDDCQWGRHHNAVTWMTSTPMTSIGEDVGGTATTTTLWRAVVDAFQ